MAAFRTLPAADARMKGIPGLLDLFSRRRSAPPGELSERPMDLVLKTSGQQCPVGSNPTLSAILPCPRTQAVYPNRREDPSEPDD